jgi:alanine dehydrogenase
MIVGILKEVKTEENRVRMTPESMELITHKGLMALLEKTASGGS